MKNVFLFVAVMVTTIFGLVIANPNPIERWDSAPRAYPGEIQTTFNAPYISDIGDDRITLPAGEIQCPIPMTNRVKNYTGIQCVYSSIEMLGRWAEEPKLTNPPITSRSNCKGYSSPSRAASILRELGVKFEQSHRDREAGKKLIRKAMAEGRGALFGVPGHAMVLIHFDEENHEVKWVDNSDSTLKVQTMTMKRFLQRWDTWVLVIYADNDIIPAKLGKHSRPLFNLPIRNYHNPSQQYDKKFILVPRRRAA